MVKPISANSWREMPSTNTMGRNTHTVVKVEEMMAPATWPAPMTAARLGGTPSLLSR